MDKRTDISVNVRMTKQERKDLKRRANLAGFQGVSTFIKHLYRTALLREGGSNNEQ